MATAAVKGGALHVPVHPVRFVTSTALFQPGDGVGDGGGVDHQALAHLAHGQGAGSGEGEQPQCLIGGEGQPVWLERVLDPGEQELVDAHDRGDGGHVVGVFWPAGTPLAAGFGQGIEGVRVGHAANRMSPEPPSASSPAPRRLFVPVRRG